VLWLLSRCAINLTVGIRPTICRGPFRYSSARRSGASGVRSSRACTAGYQFVDKAELDAALASQEFKELVADFNRSWPDGVNRTRDVVSLAHDDALCLLHHVAACTLAPSNSFGGRPFARVLLSRKAPIIISPVTPSSQNCRSLSQLPCYRSYRLSNSCRGERT
jgi:hypothetical protein